MRVRHGRGEVTQWDKSWLRQLARRKWDLRPATAGVLANDVERGLLQRGEKLLDRRDVLNLLEATADSYGLTQPVYAEHA
jgi:hypothetical protein